MYLEKMRLHREQQRKKIENHREKKLICSVALNLNSVALCGRRSCVTSRTIQEAHRAIDAGGGIENQIDFLAEFKASRQDRSLPLRD
jgi:hypothetical protein